ncbi:MAG TPA: YfiR family protein [Rhizomicrobium sp.]|nr:YfiR family protein [Rhizomicrobium sp.]
MQPRVLFASVILGCVMPLAPAAADASLEYAVKAAYLPKFVPFITWPDSAFDSPAAPVTICVLGADPFGGKLEQAAGGVKSGDRAVTVRHLAGPDPSAACQMIFLGPGDPAVAEGTLDAMKGKPVVTVTDSGLKAHGVISFLIEANHVRFDIDDAAAAQDGLAVSSKLLGLAHAVKQRGQP